MAFHSRRPLKYHFKAQAQVETSTWNDIYIKTIYILPRWFQKALLLSISLWPFFNLSFISISIFTFALKNLFFCFLFLLCSFPVLRLQNSTSALAHLRHPEPNSVFFSMFQERENQNASKDFSTWNVFRT